MVENLKILKEISKIFKMFKYTIFHRYGFFWDDYFTSTQNIMIKENIENPLLKLEDSYNTPIIKFDKSKMKQIAINTTFSQLGTWAQSKSELDEDIDDF